MCILEKPLWLKTGSEKTGIVPRENGLTSDKIMPVFLHHNSDSGPEADWKVMRIDNHGSHCTPEFIALANTNRIRPYPFISHLVHWMQPLDVGVFQPSKLWHDVAIQDALAEFNIEYLLSQFLEDHLTKIRNNTYKKNSRRIADDLQQKSNLLQSNWDHFGSGLGLTKEKAEQVIMEKGKKEKHRTKLWSMERDANQVERNAVRKKEKNSCDEARLGHSVWLGSSHSHSWPRGSLESNRYYLEGQRKPGNKLDIRPSEEEEDGETMFMVDITGKLKFQHFSLDFDHASCI